MTTFSEELQGMLAEERQRYARSAPAMPGDPNTTTELGETAQRQRAAEQAGVQRQFDQMGPADHLMMNNPLAYAGTKAGIATVNRATDLADKTYRAFGGEGTPVTDFVNPMLPDMGKPESLMSVGKRRLVGGPAAFGGGMVPDALIGAGAGKVVGAGLEGAAAATRYVAPAAKRLQDIFTGLGSSARTFGGGATPMPQLTGATGKVANAAARVGGGLGAVSATEAVLNPEYPVESAVKGAPFALLGPGAHAGGRLINRVGDAFLPSHQPAVAREFLQDTLRPNAAQTAAELQANLRTPSVMDRMPYQALPNSPEMGGLHNFALKNDPGYTGRVAGHTQLQQRQLGGNLDRRTAGIEGDKMQRDLATGDMDEWLSTHSLPLNMSERAYLPGATPASPLIPGRSPAGVLEDVRTNKAKSENKPDILAGLEDLTKHADPATGIVKTAPAGAYVETTKRLNELQRSAFQYSPSGTLSINPKSAPMLGEIGDSISTMLRNPSRMADAERKELANIFGKWQDLYKGMSAPINQKEILKGVRQASAGDDLLPGARGSIRQSSIDPVKFKSEIDRVMDANDGKIWAQLSPEQQSFLINARDELIDNARKRGGFDPTDNLPIGMRGQRRGNDMDFGWLLANPTVAAELALGRTGGAMQRTGVLNLAGKQMSDIPTVQQILDDIMNNRSRRYPVTEAVGANVGRAGPAIANTPNRERR